MKLSSNGREISLPVNRCSAPRIRVSWNAATPIRAKSKKIQPRPLIYGERETTKDRSGGRRWIGGQALSRRQHLEPEPPRGSTGGARGRCRNERHGARRLSSGHGRTVAKGPGSVNA